MLETHGLAIKIRVETAIRYQGPIKLVILCFLPFVIHEPITYAALRQDIFWVGRVLLKLLAQIVNIQTNVMRFVSILISPDLHKQLIMSDHPSCILNKMIQQAVFRGAQLDEL